MLMAIIAKDTGGNFDPAPEGVHQAVCCDVVDLGLVEVTWQGKSTMRHKVNFVWQIDKMNKEGKPFLVFKRFTLSMRKNSSLLPFLESWRGKKFEATEIKQGFDVEKLIGANCMLQVIHNEGNDGKTYANVQSIQPFLKKYGEPLEVRDYIRKKDRAENESGADFEDYDDAPPPPGDEDIPGWLADSSA
jgi:hypothetical protein